MSAATVRLGPLLTRRRIGKALCLPLPTPRSPSLASTSTIHVVPSGSSRKVSDSMLRIGL